MTNKKTCQFPDSTEVSIKTIAETSSETNQSLITYEDKEAGTQSLWVPNDFIN